MAKLTAKLTSAGEFRTGEPVVLRFELTNSTNEDLHVLKWFTPLEGIHSDCLEVTKGRERVPYDGPLVKRGVPSPDAFLLVPAGQTVAAVVEVSAAYPISGEGEYQAALATEVRTAPAATPATESGRVALEREPLHGGATSFVVRGGDRPRRTHGETARLVESQAGPFLKAEAAPPTESGSVPAAREPKYNGGDAQQQTQARAAHFDAHQWCGDALDRLVGDAAIRNGLAPPRTPGSPRSRTTTPR